MAFYCRFQHSFPMRMLIILSTIFYSIGSMAQHCGSVFGDTAHVEIKGVPSLHMEVNRTINQLAKHEEHVITGLTEQALEGLVHHLSHVHYMRLGGLDAPTIPLVKFEVLRLPSELAYDVRPTESGGFYKSEFPELRPRFELTVTKLY